MSMVGQLAVGLTGDLSGLAKTLDQASKSVDGFASRMKAAGDKLAHTGKQMTTFVTLPILGIGAAFIKAAGDAEEVNSKFDTVFKDQADAVREWAREFSDATGRANVDNLKFLASIQDLFVPLGLARDEAAELSKAVVTLGTDMASFNNLPTEEVLRDIQSALVGNHETVRKYGVIIDQATLEQELFNMGVEEGAKEATAAEKALARYNLIVAGTADAQGDAVRTAGSFTNQLRSLQASYKDLAESFGTLMLPVATELVEMLKDMVEAINDLDDEQKEKLLTYLAIFAAAGPAMIAVGTIIKLAAQLRILWAAVAASPLGILIALVGIAAAAGPHIDKIYNYITGRASEGIGEVIRGGEKLVEDLTAQVRQAITVTQAVVDHFVEETGRAGDAMLQGTLATRETLAAMTADFAAAQAAAVQALEAGTRYDVAVEQFAHASEEILAKYGVANDAMVGQLWRMLSESVMAWAALTGVVEEKAAATADAVEEVADAAEDAAVEVAAFGKTTQDLIERLDEAEAVWKSTTQGTLENLDAVRDLNAIYKLLVDAEKEMVEQGYEVDDVVRDMIRRLEALGIALDGAGDGASGLSAALATLAESGVRTATEKLNSLVTSTNQMFSTFFDGLSEMKTANEELLKDHTQTLQDLADAQGDAVADAAERRADDLRDLQKNLADGKITREQYARDYADIERTYTAAVNEAADERKKAQEAEKLAYEQQKIGVGDILFEMLKDFLKAARAQLTLEAAKSTILAAGNLLIGNIKAAAGHAAAAGAFLLGAGTLALAGYEKGGIVDAAIGEPRLVVTHGPEGIFTPDQMAAMGTLDYERLGQAVAAGMYDAMSEIRSSGGGGRDLILQVNQRELGRVSLDGILMEGQRRGVVIIPA